MFLGDFIDRGPENARVFKTVRSLIDSGKAEAVMGNHEFNAIHFHTEVEGCSLRERSAKNVNQHKSFLDEFPLDAPHTREAIDWMKSLPLFWENELFRAVHACWYEPDISFLRSKLPVSRIADEQLHRSGWTEGPLWEALQTVTSGVEIDLPNGYSFLDKDGHERSEIRVGWWQAGARTWREAAQSVPDVSTLPDAELPAKVADYLYADTKPVFFGHYWLTGEPHIEAEYALCLDYSAGKDGPLVAYQMESGDVGLSADRLVVGEIKA